MIAPPIDPATGAPKKRNPWVMALLTGVVLVFLAFWIYVFLFADTTSPNQVPDRAWAKTTEATCAATAEQLAALPSARSFANVSPKSEALRQRADVGEQATALVASMVARIRSQPPADAVSRGAVDKWLADYDTYVADRQAHVAKWRAGLDPPFAETAVEGIPNSLGMDDFADANDMFHCNVPQDFG